VARWRWKAPPCHGAPPLPHYRWDSRPWRKLPFVSPRGCPKCANYARRQHHGPTRCPCSAPRPWRSVGHSEATGAPASGSGSADSPCAHSHGCGQCCGSTITERSTVRLRQPSLRGRLKWRRGIPAVYTLAPFGFGPKSLRTVAFVVAIRAQGVVTRRGRMARTCVSGFRVTAAPVTSKCIVNWSIRKQCR